MTDHDRKTIEACERLKNKMSLMDDETRGDVLQVCTAFETLLKCWDFALKTMSAPKQQEET